MTSTSISNKQDHQNRHEDDQEVDEEVDEEVDTQTMRERASRTQDGDALEATTGRGSPAHSSG